MPENSLAEKLLRGGIWVLLGKIIIGLSSLLISAILARLLAPEELATYFLAFSLVTFATFLAHLGLPYSIVRFIAESAAKGQPARAKSAIQQSLSLLFLSYLVVALSLLSGGWDWIAGHVAPSHYISSIILVGVLWILPLTFQNLLAEIFRGFNSVILATVFGGLITSLLSLIAFSGLYWITGRSGLAQIIQFSALASTCSVVLALPFLARKVSRLASIGSTIALKELLTVSAPLWGSSLFLFILSQADIWILAMYHNEEDVAIYGAASRLATLISMPLLIVNAIIPPIMARFYAENRNIELERILRSIATITGIPLGIFVMAIVPFGGLILSNIFGSYYQAGALVFAFLCFGHLVNVLMGSSGNLLIQAGRQKLLFSITMCNGAITLAMLVLSAQYAGYNGIAIASMLGALFQNVAMWYACRKTVGIDTQSLPPSKWLSLWTTNRHLFKR